MKIDNLSVFRKIESFLTLPLPPKKHITLLLKNFTTKKLRPCCNHTNNFQILLFIPTLSKKSLLSLSVEFEVSIDSVVDVVAFEVSIDSVVDDGVPVNYIINI